MQPSIRSLLRRAAFRLRLAPVALLIALLGLTPLRAAELLMIEEPGCMWCARWNAEIAPAYPNTAEGRFAPLRRADIRDLPPDLRLRRRVTFTPTFLLVEDGQELDRLEGYPGDNFFWPLLTQLLTRHTDFKGEQE